MTDNFMPVINSEWIVAMISCGAVGIIFHIIFVTRTFHHYYSNELDSKMGKIFVFGCLLLLCFNMCACVIWTILRTDIIIPLTVTACKAIYASNFLCYFIGKYILHCLLIFRIYMAFKGSTLRMSRKSMIIFIFVVSINFFIAIGVWTYSIVPFVLKGKWIIQSSEFQICTLFSDQVNQGLSVKIAAVTIGIEDFIVGSITFIVFLKRFKQIASDAHDIELFHSVTRFGVASVFSVISTLFLFTLAIPFYPNFTFILAIDTTINSLCFYCALSVGQDLYYCLCAPCKICIHRCLYISRLYPDSSPAELAGYFMHSSTTELKGKTEEKDPNQIVITTAGGLQAVIEPHRSVMDIKPVTAFARDRPRLSHVASLIFMKSRVAAVSKKPRLEKWSSEPIPRRFERKVKSANAQYGVNDFNPF